MQARAEREGLDAATAHVQSELAAADAEAGRVREHGERAAAEITERGSQALEAAAHRIVEYVLPKLPAK